jgi:benzil reductase ((S)-benzoin forming)
MNILITGHSRGLGAALATAYLAQDSRVFGLARGTLATADSRLLQVSADFAQPHTLKRALADLLPPAIALDIVYLNAGVLGPISAANALSLEAARTVMDVNVWANKVLLDCLHGRMPAPKQIILMSSGAALRGSYGWGAYALSKATLNMLAQIYAHEFPQSHLTALAPGLIDTAMQATIRDSSARDFPSLARLHAAHGSDAMPNAELVAARIVAMAGALKQLPSGGFVDLRALSADA